MGTRGLRTELVPVTHVKLVPVTHVNGAGSHAAGALGIRSRVLP
jgi:hypothetical protein